MSHIERTSATRLICHAMHWQPMGEPAKQDEGHCAMCGHALPVHTPVVPLLDAINKASFTDWAVLVEGASHVCGWCAQTIKTKAAGYDPNRDVPIKPGDFSQTYSDAVVCKDGVYPFRSNAARAWFLLNPPPPPYIVMSITQQRQHVAWLAPVNYSQSLIQIQFGRQTLVIRPDRLQAARQAYEALVRLLQALPGCAHRKSPFAVGLDRKLESLHHGVLDAKLLAWLNTDGSEADRSHATIINQLTTGEMWALGTLTATPEKPLPYQIEGETK